MGLEYIYQRKASQKANQISSEVEEASQKVKEAERVLAAKQTTQERIKDMLERQKVAEQQFSLMNLESDPVYQKAVSQGNHELIQKFRNRTLTEKEYNLASEYDSYKPLFGKNFDDYKYVTKWWKKWLVDWDNKVVLEPIYDVIVADIGKRKGMNERLKSARWISFASIWDKTFFFDSYKWFQEIDITWFKTEWTRNWGWYILYKDEEAWKWWKKKHIKKEYLLARDANTDEITISKLS